MFDDEKMEKISKAKERWEKRELSDSLSRFPQQRERFETPSEIELKEVFTPEDIKGIDYLRDLSFPGSYPFTRGVHPTMYRSRLWTMRQYAGYATAEESNRRYRYLLSEGQTGLSVAFDLPTQLGCDSDDPLARGEVGRVGVAVDSLKDMELLFQGIPLDRVSTSMTINSTAPIILAMYLAVARKQGVPLERLSGTIQNDILKEYISRGTYIFPPTPSLRLTIDIFSYCIEKLPRWNFISISGYHIREAGATAVQEVAFTLANAVAYVEAAIRRGLPVDSFAPRISFFFNSHNHFLEEVAKFRAARRLWARIMKERFHAKNPRSLMLRFHTQTAGSTLTAQQPDNNIVRVALQALAAVLGGTQSLHTNSREEALALPSEESVQIALRTQQIIAYESGVADTVDPLGGSFLIERLTSDIERRALEYIESIDQMEGALKAIETGYFQREIQESAYRYQKEVEEGRQVIVGVNRFATEEKAPFQLMTIDPRVEREQIKHLRRLKEERDSNLVARSLEEVERVARSEQNLMPAFLQAVESYATVGEISDCLRKVFGVYQEPTII